MKYADLVVVMQEFRLGKIKRADMVVAFALWQRPVEIISVLGERQKREAVEAIIR